MAQLGQGLIDGATKSMAEDFFKRFDHEMRRQQPESYAAKMVTGNAIAAPASGVQTWGVPVWVWAGAAAAAIAAIVLVAWLLS